MNNNIVNHQHQMQGRLLLSRLLRCAPTRRSRARPTNEPPQQPRPQPLLGTFAAPIDPAGNTILPAPLHHQQTTWVLTRGDDGCLHLLPPATWRTLAQQVGNAPTPAATPARTLRRQLFASAAPLMPDSRGAIIIPPDLRAYAALDAQAVFVGLYTYIEIWSHNRWQAIVENL